MVVDNSVLIEMLPGVSRSATKQSLNSLSVNEDLLFENAIATVVRHGNFTIAMIDYFGKVYLGEAKRNPIDTPNAKRGDRIALSRALKSLLVDISN